MRVILTATGLPPLELEVKEIDGNDNIQVGPFPNKLGAPGQNTGITARTNISAYTVALGATIFADEQKRPAIDNIEIVRATYEEEPTVAVRSIMVDPCGNLVGPENPLPVAIDGTMSIGDVSIVECGNTLVVNPDGSINVDTKGVGLFTLPYDSIAATYPSSTVEDYQSYLGGLSGTPVQLVVVTYTDSTKNFITTVVRTPQGP